LTLKEEFLKALMEDEKFRYAVVGYLNLSELRGALTRLAEAQARTEERVGRLEEALNRLAEAQARTEERVGRLEEALNRLAEAQARTEARLDELSAVVKTLSIHVGRLSDVVGFSLEDIARVVVPGWLLRHEGIEVESLERRFLTVDGEQVEVNLYGEGKKGGERIVVLGEVRSRIYGDDVRETWGKLSRVEEALKAPTYKLMFGFLIHPTAEKEAETLKMKVIASYMR
jgi:hypothetical protein